MNEWLRQLIAQMAGGGQQQSTAGPGRIASPTNTAKYLNQVDYSRKLGGGMFGGGSVGGGLTGFGGSPGGRAARDWSGSSIPTMSQHILGGGTDVDVTDIVSSISNNPVGAISQHILGGGTDVDVTDIISAINQQSSSVGLTSSDGGSETGPTLMQAKSGGSSGGSSGGGIMGMIANLLGGGSGGGNVNSNLANTLANMAGVDAPTSGGGGIMAQIGRQLSRRSGRFGRGRSRRSGGFFGSRR